MLARRGIGRGRRGGTSVIAIMGLTTTLTLVGVEADVGRMFVVKQKDEIIADMITLAAAQQLPDATAAAAAAAAVAGTYESSYGTSFDYTLNFYPPTGLATSVDTDITDSSPSLFAGMVSGGSGTAASGGAAASRTVPVIILQGAVPLAIQYDDDFELPTDGMASNEVITLKYGKRSGSGSGNGKKKGEAWALDLGSGADDFREYLKFGYTSKLEVDDTVYEKSGTMTGPIEQALISDTDSRMNRALAYPYTNDTYLSFHKGNPRVVVCPLVDWQNSSGGHANLLIRGFGAFWLDSYASGSGTITGRFVRYTVSGAGGPGWDGVSIDVRTSGATFDGGFWSVNQTE